MNKFTEDSGYMWVLTRVNDFSFAIHDPVNRDAIVKVRPDELELVDPLRARAGKLRRVLVGEGPDRLERADNQQSTIGPRSYSAERSTWEQVPTLRCAGARNAASERIPWRITLRANMVPEMVRLDCDPNVPTGADST